MSNLLVPNFSNSINESIPRRSDPPLTTLLDEGGRHRTSHLFSEADPLEVRRIPYNTDGIFGVVRDSLL